ncbi:neuropeptide FF receptor 1-like [Branchiostoma floridae]|uniref:Neuropeptide FF receptor 1-like n=1 Tax=Branchiostoma floridae TaxID=7739 RepID=A0A9J7LY46_BRAFL|nr:neuropeptide FF receptor 1-like [Branchiostoma floridae]
MEKEAGPLNMTWNDSWTADDFIFDKFKQDTIVIVIFVLAYLSILLLCVVGNLLVIVVVVWNRNMRTVTNFFITNLAVADLLVGVFCLPFNLADNILTSWPFGEAMCKVFLSVQVLSVSASVFTLVAIAVDRYYAVVHPTSPRLTQTAVLYILGTVWIVAAATSAPQGLVLTSVTYEGVYTADGQVLTACEEVWPGDHFKIGYSLGLFAMCYVFPLFIIALLYVKVGLTIWNRSKPGNNQSRTLLNTVQHLGNSVSYSSHSSTVAIHRVVMPQSSSPETQKKLHVIRMLLVVVVVFALSWLPLYILTIVSAFVEFTDDVTIVTYHYVFPVVRWMAFFNCGVNPIIYGYYNKNFQKGFYQLVRSSS